MKKSRHEQHAYCGMLGYGKVVAGRILDYLEDVMRNQYEIIYDHRTLKTGNAATISLLQVNDTASRYVILAKSLTNDAKCDGTRFSDHIATYDNVVVQASLVLQ